jgi:hypothetical protein
VVVCGQASRSVDALRLAALSDPALFEYQVNSNSAALYLLFVCSARRVVSLLRELRDLLLSD